MADLSNRKYYTSDFVGLTTNAYILAAAAVVCLAWYEASRHVRRLPRWRLAPPARPAPPDPPDNPDQWELAHLYTPRQYHAVCPTAPLPRWPLFWVWPSLMRPDWWYASHAGIDALAYVRFLRASAWWMFLQLLTTLPALLAVHLRFSHCDSRRNMACASLAYLVTTPLDPAQCSTLSSSHCARTDNHEGRKWLWVHLVAMYWLTFSWCLALFWAAWGVILNRRRLILRMRSRTLQGPRAVHDPQQQQQLQHQQQQQQQQLPHHDWAPSSTSFPSPLSSPSPSRPPPTKPGFDPHLAPPASYPPPATSPPPPPPPPLPPLPPLPPPEASDPSIQQRLTMEEAILDELARQSGRADDFSHPFVSVAQAQQDANLAGWRYRTLMFANLPRYMRNEQALTTYIEEHLGVRGGPPGWATATASGTDTPGEAFRFSESDGKGSGGRQSQWNGSEGSGSGSGSGPTEFLPSPIQDIVFVRKMAELDSLVNRRDATLAKLELAHMELAGNVLRAVKAVMHSAVPPEKNTSPDMVLAQRLGRFVTSASTSTSASSGTGSGSGWKPSVPASQKASEFELSQSFWHELLALPRTLLDRHQPISQLGSGTYKGDVVPTIDLLVTKLRLLTALVDAARSLPEDKWDPTPVAFITFRDPRQARLVWKELSDRVVPHVTLAPERRDIIWDRLMHTTFAARMVRGLGVSTFFWLFTVFWMLPTQAAASVLNNIGGVTHVDQKGGSSAFANHNQWLRFVSGTLPTLLVSGVMLLVPEFIYQVNLRAHHFTTRTELYDQCLCRYWKFVVCNTVILFSVGATTLQTILVRINSPQQGSVLSSIAFAFPTAAPFFCAYLMLNIATQTGAELIQAVIGLVQAVQAVSARSPRIRMDKVLPRKFGHAIWLPLHLTVMTIVFIFAIFNPLVIPFALVYLWCALVVFKKDLAYVYLRRFHENQGIIYLKRVLRFSLDGLVVAQVVLAIFFAVTKEKAVYLIFTILLIPLTVLSKLVGTRLWMSQCRALDDDEANAACGVDVLPSWIALKEVYKPTALHAGSQPIRPRRGAYDIREPYSAHSPYPPDFDSSSPLPFHAGATPASSPHPSPYPYASDVWEDDLPQHPRAAGRYPRRIPVVPHERPFWQWAHRWLDRFCANGFDSPGWVSLLYSTPRRALLEHHNIPLDTKAPAVIRSIVAAWAARGHVFHPGRAKRERERELELNQSRTALDTDTEEPIGLGLQDGNLPSDARGHRGLRTHRAQYSLLTDDPDHSPGAYDHEHSYKYDHEHKHADEDADLHHGHGLKAELWEEEEEEVRLGIRGRWARDERARSFGQPSRSGLSGHAGRPGRHLRSHSGASVSGEGVERPRRLSHMGSFGCAARSGRPSIRIGGGGAAAYSDEHADAPRSAHIARRPARARVGLYGDEDGYGYKEDYVGDIDTYGDCEESVPSYYFRDSDKRSMFVEDDDNDVDDKAEVQMDYPDAQYVPYESGNHKVGPYGDFKGQVPSSRPYSPFVPHAPAADAPLGPVPQNRGTAYAGSPMPPAYRHNSDSTLVPVSFDPLTTGTVTGRPPNRPTLLSSRPSRAGAAAHSPQAGDARDRPSPDWKRRPSWNASSSTLVPQRPTSFPSSRPDVRTLLASPVRKTRGRSLSNSHAHQSSDSLPGMEHRAPLQPSLQPPIRSQPASQPHQHAQPPSQLSPQPQTAESQPLARAHPPIIWDDRPDDLAHYNTPAYSSGLDRFLWLPFNPAQRIDLADTLEWLGPAFVSSWYGGSGCLDQQWDGPLPKALAGGGSASSDASGNPSHSGERDKDSVFPPGNLPLGSLASLHGAGLWESPTPASTLPARSSGSLRAGYSEEFPHPSRHLSLPKTSSRTMQGMPFRLGGHTGSNMVAGGKNSEAVVGSIGGVGAGGVGPAPRKRGVPLPALLRRVVVEEETRARRAFRVAEAARQVVSHKRRKQKKLDRHQARLEDGYSAA